MLDIVADRICAEYEFSETEKRGLEALAQKFVSHDFYRDPACGHDDFCAEFAAVASTELRELLASMSEGRGPDVLILKDVPVDNPLPDLGGLEQNIAAKGRVSETVLSGLTALMKAKLQREPSSHQPDFLQQIYPVDKFEQESSGRGRAPLPFHAENVFLQTPPSFLALLCLQGQSGVFTEYLPVADILHRLTPENLEQLKAPIYSVRSGDGFQARALDETPVLDAIANGWTISRIYEEDRIHTDDPAGRDAIHVLKAAIAEAKASCVRSVEMTSGTGLLIANGVAKGRYGGVLHGRKGQIMSQAPSTPVDARRWLQRACIEINYL
ncbi:oxygenase [Nitratireductor indicus]|uniref:Oxygenase n=1 Tax=Nitratireductor indicus C115 TaxID=1231190 RepID=K2NZW5_9HYPH|nr:oxygenase [Nitratireductor indicus]EKF40581.1 oxygenase [Nitratireductor indicus C115]MDS1136728.1 hypothetical protein [Nitratireductor indicus]SFQ48858.1 hypothetical protein SAMN05216176_104252 [Nitratireductor indicus]